MGEISANLRSLSTNIVQYLNRSMLAMRTGLGFSGARDYYKTFGYSRSLSHADFMGKYLRQDIAQRVIKAPVDAIWQEPPEIMTKKEVYDSKNVWKEWDKFSRDFDVYPALRNTDLFAGLGMYSILLVGFDDGRGLDQPLKRAKPGTLLYLQPYLEGSVDIQEYESDPRNPRFQLPSMYKVTPTDPQMTAVAGNSAVFRSRGSFPVHWTRVLHVADNTLENMVFGHSRLEPIYNILDDILKVAGGSAETYWLAGNRGLQIDVDKEMQMEPGDEASLSDEIDEYMHELRRVIRTRGVKVSPLGGNVVDPKGPFNTAISLLSATTGIPQRVLLGAEAGQLASQQDRAAWAERTRERMASFAEPVMLKPFVRMMGDAGVIEVPEDAWINWPEPFKMNPLERAQTSAQMARSATNVVRAVQGAQEGMFPEYMSIEEARAITAPSAKMPVLRGLAVGKQVPDITLVDPMKFVPPPAPFGAPAASSTDKKGVPAPTAPTKTAKPPAKST